MERFSYEQSEKKNILSSGGAIHDFFQNKKTGGTPPEFI